MGGRPEPGPRTRGLLRDPTQASLLRAPAAVRRGLGVARPGQLQLELKQTLPSSTRTLLNNLANHLQRAAVPAVTLVSLASAQVEVVLMLDIPSYICENRAT